ncbi:MAG: shikimate kinase [Myxococcota bacterium]
MGGKTVWLVGMMGAGKSSVGPALAERLGVPFFDTDAEVERCAGTSVAALFAAEGEAAFRHRELEATRRLAGKPAVVALGGGALSEPRLREVVAGGRRVYLRARPETLTDRLGAGEGRPLLTGLDGSGRLARLGELLAARETEYRRAELVIDTDGLALPEVVDAVARGLEGS